MYSGSDGLCDATVKVAWLPQLVRYDWGEPNDFVRLWPWLQVQDITI